LFYHLIFLHSRFLPHTANFTSTPGLFLWKRDVWPSWLTRL
jgi:hypothetical protein